MGIIEREARDGEVGLVIGNGGWSDYIISFTIFIILILQRVKMEICISFQSYPM